MSADTAYIDTSAVVKLLVQEPESAALRAELARWPRRASAALLRLELVRAARRAGQPGMVERARQQLRALNLVRLDDPLLDRAAALGSDRLRSLDAIHLAAAEALGPELGVVVTYDQRMRDAAVDAGFAVISPA